MGLLQERQHNRRVVLLISSEVHDLINGCEADHVRANNPLQLIVRVIQRRLERGS